ncbi:MAG: hypothetical protein KGL39_24355 [Patescibacteria group bacterium]|nr:hypothetical protein [Patescibacteria group bacterium]
MKKHYTKTVAHSNMAHHSGKTAGAGELSFGMGPGKVSMKTKPNVEGFGIQDSGKAPKGVKKYDQE